MYIYNRVMKYISNIIKLMVLVMVTVLIGLFIGAGYKVSDVLAILSYIILGLLLIYVIIELVSNVLRVHVVE